VTVLLLSNVGERDLLLEGKEVRPARLEGQKLLEGFERLRGRLSLQMLTPVVEELLRRHPQIEVVLYGTDQPEGTDARYWDTDTLYIAKAAARLLEERYGDKGVSRVWVKLIQANPSLYDDMLAYFRDQLSPRLAWVKGAELCYAYPVGGTPAANMGLLLAAIEAFGERCRTLYLPRGERHPVAMDLGDQVRRGVARRLAGERLRDLSFGTAACLLEEAGAPKWAVWLARYATDRYHFNFDAASAHIEAAKAACGADIRARAACERLRLGLIGLRDRDIPSLLAELYHNGSLAYRRGEHAAFLGVVFRFQEALLRYMVETLYPGFSTDVHDSESRARFREALEARPALLAHLKGQMVNGRPLDCTKPDRLALRAMVRFACDGGGAEPEQAAQCRRALSIADRLDCLSGLRNRSVIAHGFEGVSEARILETYAEAGHGGSPLEDMAATLGALGIEAGEDPFQTVAELALRELEKL